MILIVFDDLFGLLVGTPHPFGRMVLVELSNLMQSSRRFQRRSGSPGQPDTADSRSHLLLTLLLRAAHDFSEVDGFIWEAESEDGIINSAVGRYHLNRKL